MAQEEKRMKIKEKVKYAFYTMLHPVDAFYEIRFRGKGSVPLAILFVFLFAAAFSANRQYAGFVVNDLDPMTLNSFRDIAIVFATYFLFCISNWSITCLSDGVGRFKDILTVVGYSMLPMFLLFTAGTLMSRGIVQNEEEFYYLLLAAAILWFVMLALCGLMTIHNFTLGKTLVALIFTFAAMLIIMFLVVLLFSLIQQVFAFFESIYNEIMLRV